LGALIQGFRVCLGFWVQSYEAMNEKNAGTSNAFKYMLLEVLFSGLWVQSYEAMNERMQQVQAMHSKICSWRFFSQGLGIDSRF
jgi:hypothetical protein